jgi:hypothetical protein
MIVRHFGAVLLSPGLTHVLLVQRRDGSGWEFPSGPADSATHLVAAAAAVKALLGIEVQDMLMRSHWVEVRDLWRRPAPVGLPPTS